MVVKNIKNNMLFQFVRHYLGQVYKFTTRYVNKKRKILYIPPVRNSIYIEPTSYCNLDCEFCAYGKKTSIKKNVLYKDFVSRVSNIVSCGFDHIGLTPITGDIFMDKGVFEKIKYLERNNNIDSYHFYTNAILLDKRKIDFVFNQKKLSSMHVSIYGYNLKSFKVLTNGTDNEYKRLISNLKYMESLPVNLTKNKLYLDLRVDNNFNIDCLDNDCDLLNIYTSLIHKLNYNFKYTNIYNNWGGVVKQSNVKSEINIRDFKTFKYGACSLIFNRIQIMSDGRVNACACRDANATLCIGDLSNNKLEEILSIDGNTPYKKLIQNQQKGNFNKICNSCDFYKSIYDKSYPHENKDEFVNLLNKIP